MAGRAGYPKEFEREVFLKDGTPVRIRPVRPDDEPRIVALHSRLSADTRYHRFFSSKERLPPNWAHFFANVDYHRRMALVAESMGAGELALMAVGRYEGTEEEGTAELAFVVEDRWQGKGLGAILLQDIVRAAQSRGIRRFRASVLADNDRMLHLFARHAQVLEQQTERGVTELLLAPPDE